MSASGPSPHGNAAQPALLSGTWFIVRSSLKLWRARHNPSVTYAPLPGDQLLDAVRFTAARRPHLIVGLDTPDAQGGYVWRGLGLLGLTSSRWQVLASGPEWAITCFERTPFTSAGLDIYARTPYLLPETEQQVWAALEAAPAARPYLEKLFAPHHTFTP